jgi:integrase
MSLTDTAIRTAKPADKAYRLYDAGGLYVEVSPSGGKLWRCKYRFEGKENRLAFGAYPAVSLADARRRRDEARKLLANGIDPNAVKKSQKAARADALANSLEVMGREWLLKKRGDWVESSAEKITSRLERDVFPYIGKTPVTEITAPMVLSVLRRIEGRGAIETAHRVKGYISQIICYAISTGRRTERDPCPDLRDALPSPSGKHFAAITDPIKAGGLMRAIDGYDGTPIVKAALSISPLVFLRPGELRKAEWAEFDFDNALWTIPAAKLKRKKEEKENRNNDHLVPLARQAVVLLQELHPLTGHGRYVFPGERNNGRPMSENSINAALQRMGYNTSTEMTAHGFRAMARTLLAEQLHQDERFIERQLAHGVDDPLRGAYNRTKFIKERTAMMQAWADYLDALKVGGKVIPLRPAA